jgi:hypothetical protein
MVYSVVFVHRWPYDRAALGLYDLLLLLSSLSSVVNVTEVKLLLLLL